jgi:hypothetical protein
METTILDLLHHCAYREFYPLGDKPGYVQCFFCGAVGVSRDSVCHQERCLYGAFLQRPEPLEGLVNLVAALQVSAVIPTGLIIDLWHKYLPDYRGQCIQAIHRATGNPMPLVLCQVSERWPEKDPKKCVEGA